MTFASTFFSSPALVFSSAIILRAILLVYGAYQDSVSALKYTDIDYYVFTDAARAVARGSSPYDRATYRYTPLLAWILLPTAKEGLWFHFGKAIFALSDIVAGWLILIVLRRKGLDQKAALKFASVWLLNPMVANISTRGSSEGLLCVMVMALLWSFETNQISLAGLLLGLCVHFKIYPFIYGASMLWALQSREPLSKPLNILQHIRGFFNRSRVTLLLVSLTTFAVLNVIMYIIYGPPFLQHTFMHHLTRIDHRHNFSPYNTLLYLSSAQFSNHTISLESIAFLPQLLLSTVLIPLSLSRHNLPATLLAQTLAFVAFNKVCTSQYFLWYLVFLPLYLPGSSLLAKPRLGFTVLILWVVGQAAWLQQGYQLEFLGHSTFVPGLWLAGLGFFGVNCWILGVVSQDIVERSTQVRAQRDTQQLSNNSSATVEMKRSRSPSNMSTAALKPSPASIKTRSDRTSSLVGTNIGNAHLGPRHRVLRSSSPGVNN